MSGQIRGGGDSGGSNSGSEDNAFPADRLKRLLRKRNLAGKVDDKAAACLAGVLEYLTTEVLELAGNAARDNKKDVILPRHILMAIQSDDGLRKLAGQAMMPGTGVMPNVQCILSPANESDDDDASDSDSE